MSNSLRPHGVQHTRLPSPTPGAFSNSCPLSWWYHPTISSFLSSPSPPAFNLSQHQGFFQWVSSSHQMAKVLKLQVKCSYPGWKSNFLWSFVILIIKSWAWSLTSSSHKRSEIRASLPAANEVLQFSLSLQLVINYLSLVLCFLNTSVPLSKPLSL